MICNVKLIIQKLGKRRFQVKLQREELPDEVFCPAKIADAIEGWGTIYQVERVQIAGNNDFANLYVVTTDLSLDARMLKRSILAEHNILQNKKP